MGGSDVASPRQNDSHSSSHTKRTMTHEWARDANSCYIYKVHSTWVFRLVAGTGWHWSRSPPRVVRESWRQSVSAPTTTCPGGLKSLWPQEADAVRGWRSPSIITHGHQCRGLGQQVCSPRQHRVRPVCVMHGPPWRGSELNPRSSPQPSFPLLQRMWRDITTGSSLRGSRGPHPRSATIGKIIIYYRRLMVPGVGWVEDLHYSWGGRVASTVPNPRPAIPRRDLTWGVLAAFGQKPLRCHVGSHRQHLILQEVRVQTELFSHSGHCGHTYESGDLAAVVCNGLGQARGEDRADGGAFDCTEGVIIRCRHTPRSPLPDFPEGGNAAA
jgi:hypothetical protein